MFVQMFFFYPPCYCNSCFFVYCGGACLFPTAWACDFVPFSFVEVTGMCFDGFTPPLPAASFPPPSLPQISFPSSSSSRALFVSQPPIFCRLPNNKKQHTTTTTTTPTTVKNKGGGPLVRQAHLLPRRRRRDRQADRERRGGARVHGHHRPVDAGFEGRKVPRDYGGGGLAGPPLDVSSKRLESVDLLCLESLYVVRRCSVLAPQTFGVVFVLFLGGVWTGLRVCAGGQRW